MFVYNILLIIQIIVALSIIGLVLIQHGKGADAGAAFGGGSSGTVFGSRGSSNFLSRSTGILAAVFFANSLALAWLVAHRGEANTFSADKTVVPVEQPRKVQPAPVAEPAAPSDVPTNVGSPEKDEAKLVVPSKENSTPTDIPVNLENPVKETTAPADVPQ
jgi:preprotein translocase subunit SecG